MIRHLVGDCPCLIHRIKLANMNQSIRQRFAPIQKFCCEGSPFFQFDIGIVAIRGRKNLALIRTIVSGEFPLIAKHRKISTLRRRKVGKCRHSVAICLHRNIIVHTLHVDISALLGNAIQGYASRAAVSRLQNNVRSTARNREVFSEILSPIFYILSFNPINPYGTLVPFWKIAKSNRWI